MIEVREGRFGKCVHATRAIEPGTVIYFGRGRRSHERTRHTVQVDHDAHLVLGPPAELINHSCEPNSGLLLPRVGDRIEVHALRPIEPGEELSFDYATFETDIRFMPPCLCGAPGCRGRVTGVGDLSADRRAAYGPYIAEFLREADVLVAASV